MTPDQFKSWADHLGLKSGRAVSRALGLNRDTALKYLREGTDDLTVRLAMTALAVNLGPWPLAKGTDE